MWDIKSRSQQEWEAANPILRKGELGHERDSGRIKVGDGRTRWLSLAFTRDDAVTPELVAANLPSRLSDAALKTTIGSGLADGSILLAIASTHRALFAKTTSSTEHAATIYQAGTSGVDVAAALNVVSDNPESSAMYLSGTEKQRGTFKVTHHGYSDASDASASAVSVDLLTAGSAARGIYVRSTDGGQTGDGIAIRVSAAVASISREDFVVKATGRCGMGTGLGSAPAGQLEVSPADNSTPGIVTRGLTSGTNQQEWRRPSDGAVRTRISNSAQFVTQEVAFLAGPAVQVGATSTQVGGGSGVVGVANAVTIPTTNPTGGGVMYAEGGALKWRGSNGTVTIIAPA